MFFTRSSGIQVLVDAFDFDHFSGLVVTQLYHPTKNVLRPLRLGNNPVGLGAQCMQKSRDGAVVPANKDVQAMRPGADFVHKLLELFASKPAVNGQPGGPAQWRNCQTWTPASGRIGGGENVIEFQRLGIDGEIFEIIDIALGPLFTHRRDKLSPLSGFSPRGE